MDVKRLFEQYSGRPPLFYISHTLTQTRACTHARTHTPREQTPLKIFYAHYNDPIRPFPRAYHLFTLIFNVVSRNLPVFDLFHIGTQHTPLSDVLKDDQMKAVVVSKYMNIFKQFKKA